jgi:hypothetical protein
MRRRKSRINGLSSNRHKPLSPNFFYMDQQAIQDAISAVYSALETLEGLVAGAGEATETGEEGGAMPSDSRAMLA